MKSIRKNKYKSLKDILKPSTDAVKQDPYDKHIYNKELKPTQKDMIKEEKKLKKYYPPIEDLNADVFTGLYKYKPEYTDPELMKSSHKLNHTIIDKLKDSKKFIELRESTKLDPVLSMLGTVNMQEEVKKVLEESKEEIEELQKELEAAQQAMQDAQASNQSKNKGQDDEGNSTGIGPNDEKISLEEAKKRLEEALKKADEFAEKKFNRVKVNNMVTKASKQINEITETISNWGLDRSDQFMYAGHEEKLALLNELRNSQKLREIAEFLGRLKMLKFREGRDKTKKGYEEITDIIESNKIDKMLVSEYNNLLDPDLKLIFLQKFLDNKLLSYKFKGKTKNERGPIICCIDSSASMSGEAEVWAKGVGMGLLETARAQKRDLFVIHFSDSYDKSTLKTNNFTKENHYNVRELIEFANYFESGGTLFHPALDLARDLIGTDQNYKKSDIVFITDGQSALTDSWVTEFNTWKSKNKVHVVSVLINSGWGGASDSTLKEFSNKIYNLSDIMGESGLLKAMDILDEV